MQVFARLEVWLQTILQTVEAREIGCRLRWYKSEVERQTVLHERDRHPLDDSAPLLELLEDQLLNLPVPIVQLFDVELVEDADSDALEKSRRIDLVVHDTLDVSNPV